MTPTTLPGFVFVIPPGESRLLNAIMVFSAGVATTGALSDREPTSPGLVRRRGWAHLRRRCFASEVAAQTITALIGSATTELFTV